MSTTNLTPQNGTDSTERITDLRELRAGDRIVFGSYAEPRTVTELGVRELRDERIDTTLETPIVRVEGDRANAKMHVLAHKLDRLGRDGPRLAEMGAIVACEGGDLEHGETVDVVRVATAEVEA